MLPSFSDRNVGHVEFHSVLQSIPASNELHDAQSPARRIFRVEETIFHPLERFDVFLLSNYLLRRSDSLDQLGSPSWALALCLLLAWILVGLCIIQGIKSSGKVHGDIASWIASVYSFVLGGLFHCPVPLRCHLCLDYSRSDTARCQSRSDLLPETELEQNPRVQCKSHDYGMMEMMEFSFEGLGRRCESGRSFSSHPAFLWKLSSSGDLFPLGRLRSSSRLRQF